MEKFATSEGDAWESYVTSHLYPLALQSVAPRFRAIANSDSLPRGISITEMVMGSTSLERTPRLVRSAPSDDLLFLIRLAGTARIEQGGVQSELKAGHATFFDPSAPYRIDVGSGEDMVIMVPRNSIPLPHGDSRTIRLRPLGATLAPLRILQLLSEEILSSSPGSSSAEREGVAAAALELLRNLAGIASGLDSPTSTSSTSALRELAKVTVLARLGESSLTVESLASELHVSIRRLSDLFGPDDSPGAFIRRSRLERARQDLLRAQGSGDAVASVAHRWGYSDASAFSRAFRTEFGVTPSELRRA